MSRFITWLIVFLIFNAPLYVLYVVLINQGINGWAAVGIVLGANLLGYIEGIVKS